MNARAEFQVPEDLLRVPPHSIDAEAGVLSGLLLNNGAWDRVGDLLTESDFYSYEHKLIFTAIRALILANKPADVITVNDELKGHGEDEQAGGLAYLSELAQYVPSAGTLRRYAEIIRERSILRSLVSASDEIATQAFNPQGQSVEAILDQAEARIMKIGEGRSSGGDEWVSVAQGMVDHTQVLDDRCEGKVKAISTGLSDLDEYLEGGVRSGELVIVGARPSMGKTALALTMGVHMAREHGVGFLSMEMSHADVNDRLTALLGNVSMSEVKRPSKGKGIAWDRVVDGIERAKTLNFHTCDQGGLNINQVRTKARNLKRIAGLEVLIVDYIGLMPGLDSKLNRNYQLGEISRGLKNLAKELGISVVCLAQLNRKAEERPEQMPMMSDLRDSGEIEQDADVILFIKRPIMSNPELGAEWTHYAKLSVAKNRQGRCGLLNLSYIGEQTRFSGWAGEVPTKQAKTRGKDL